MSKAMVAAALLAFATAQSGCSKEKPQITERKKEGGDSKQPDTKQPDSKQPDTKQPDTTSKPAEGQGSIVGIVKFEGTAPEMPELPRFDGDTPKDAKCATHEKAHFLIVNGGGIKDALVRLPMGTKGPAVTPPAATLTQQNCLYTPTVVAAMTGQKLIIKNADPTNHNIRGFVEDESQLNIVQSAGDPDLEVDLPESGVMDLKCDVHPWMLAHAVVTDHPYYATTGDDGSFKIAVAPAGTYTIEAWHPHMGSKTAEVTVENGKEAKVEIVFKAEDYKAPQ